MTNFLKSKSFSMRDVNNLKNLCKDVGLVLKDRNGKVIEKDGEKDEDFKIFKDYK